MAEVTKYYCDICGSEIPTHKAYDPLGFEYTAIQTGRINCPPLYDNFDMLRYNVFCCELCAEKISHGLDLLKFNTLLLSGIKKY